ncbi:MAG: rhamnulokinase [Muribaculaceae bacterium]|nr:rhamnulokinase [Muribaculaceae bacterium]
MMNKSYYLAVDLGATSGRTILASYDGEKVEMEELTRFKHPMLPIGGHIFWNLPGLYSEILEGMKVAAEKVKELGGELKSIGIDTWGCDVAYFNEDGTIAGLPYCYRDSHTAGAVDEFCKEISREEVYGKTGIQFMDFNTLFQLHTLKRNGAAAIKNASKILFIPDALAYMLTGNAVTETTVASTSQILNPNTGELDGELLSKLDLTIDKFGKLVNPGAVIGSLTKEVQQYTGLGDVPVVAVAGHDTASAVIAVPTPDPDYAYLSCGTWSLLGIESDKPIITEDSFKYNFTNEGGIDGTVRFLKNICGLWVFERCRAELPEAPKEISELVAMCEKSSCESLINPDDASFANPESMTEAIRVYCQNSGQSVPETVADYVRVVFRSLAARVAEVLDILKKFSDHPVNRLHVIGGGSRNAYLMQFIADDTKLPVVAGPTECTALGNVLVQLRADGKAPTLDDMRSVAIKSTETKTYFPN